MGTTLPLTASDIQALVQAGVEKQKKPFLARFWESVTNGSLENQAKMVKRARKLRWKFCRKFMRLLQTGRKRRRAAALALLHAILKYGISRVKGKIDPETLTLYAQAVVDRKDAYLAVS